MTYFEDSRSPLKRKFYDDKPNELNPYYEGLLSQEDKDEMVSYDIGVFGCLNAFEDNFEAAIDCIETEEDFTEEELEFLCEERTQKLIRLAVKNWAEMQRNEFVIAKLDDTPNEEYDKRYEVFEKDFNSLSLDDFLKKYKTRDYDDIEY